MLVWPDSLPNPNTDGFTINSGARAEIAEVLFGPTRLAVKARTAPMDISFNATFTREQQETFEEFYRNALETRDGEFYARWIGGSRVVAFAEPYSYAAFGAGWILSGRVVRTRIDESACDDYIEEWFGSIYRADLGASDIYQADEAATDIYADDFSLQFIADHEC